MLDCEPVKRLSINGPFLSDPVTNLNNKRLHHIRLPFYSCCFLIQCRTERMKESGVEFVLKRPGHGCVCMPRKSACPQIHHAHHLNHDLPNKHCYAVWQAPALAPHMWVSSHCLDHMHWAQQSCSNGCHSKRKIPVAQFIHFQATLHLGLVSPVNTPHQCVVVWIENNKIWWVFLSAGVSVFKGCLLFFVCVNKKKTTKLCCFSLNTFKYKHNDKTCFLTPLHRKTTRLLFFFKHLWIETQEQVSTVPVKAMTARTITISTVTVSTVPP